MSLPKKHKPITKKFWHLLRFTPPFIRQKMIRSQFEANYDLASDYVFKQAETEEEIEEALNIVYDSYTLLGYIDQRPEKVHFNAYLCLPTTSILIIKYKHEVIGTMSIVPNSSLGLPSEKTWDLSSIKSKSRKLAEISSLSIKKGHKTAKGHLLLTLCKFMYEYCVDVLKLDGIVIAATMEVEPFYTDLLLFQKVLASTGQKHDLVKGNKSTCCYLNFEEAQKNYFKVYGKEPSHKNLHHFFTQYKSPNIFFPSNHFSMQGLLAKKNKSITLILKKYPNLNQMFSSLDKLVIANLDPSFEMDNVINFDTSHTSRKLPRISIHNMSAFLYHASTNSMMSVELIDVSAQGFCLEMGELPVHANQADKYFLILEFNGEALFIQSSKQWARNNKMGCSISNKSLKEWEMFVSVIFKEVNLSIHQERSNVKKAA